MDLGVSLFKYNSCNDHSPEVLLDINNFLISGVNASNCCSVSAAINIKKTGRVSTFILIKLNYLTKLHPINIALRYV